MNLRTIEIKNRGFYNRVNDKKVALLAEGEKLKVIDIREGVGLIHAVTTVTNEYWGITVGTHVWVEKENCEFIG